MEDLEILMEYYIEELKAIMRRDVTDVSRLMGLADSIKQFYSKEDRAIKGAITRECNSALRYVKCITGYVMTHLDGSTCKYEPKEPSEFTIHCMDNAIATATRRYMHHVLDM